MHVTVKDRMPDRRYALDTGAEFVKYAIDTPDGRHYTVDVCITPWGSVDVWRAKRRGNKRQTGIRTPIGRALTEAVYLFEGLNVIPGECTR